MTDKSVASSDMGVFSKKDVSESKTKLRELVMAKMKVTEAMCAKVHQAYCEKYKKKHGKTYWTGGDYSKLDEETKDFDRATAQAVTNENVRAIGELFK